MSELQYSSSVRCTYYHFVDAYGVIQSGEDAGKLLYLGSESQVKGALQSGLNLPSTRAKKANEILERERVGSEGRL